MGKKKSLILVLVILTIISIVLLVVSIVTKPEVENFSIDGIIPVKNEEVLNDFVLDNVKITNVSILTKDGVSTYKARVYNITDEDLNVKKLTINFYIGNDKKSVDSLMNAKIEKNSFVYINVTSLGDISNIDKIEYIVE